MDEKKLFIKNITELFPIFIQKNFHSRIPEENESFTLFLGGKTNIIFSTFN